MKFIKILLSIVVAIYTLIHLGLHFFFGGIFTGPVYYEKDLIKNYEKKEVEIKELIEYFKSIVPLDAHVDIEFESKRELAIFHVHKEYPYDQNWNLKINSTKTDSLLTEINWTKENLRILKKKLDKANCISISGNSTITIGWQRGGMSKYYYRIFDQPLTKKEIKKHDDGCTSIFYKDNIVLQHGGGAIGSYCFPKKEK